MFEINEFYTSYNGFPSIDAKEIRFKQMHDKPPGQNPPNPKILDRGAFLGFVYFIRGEFIWLPFQTAVGLSPKRLRRLINCKSDLPLETASYDLNWGEFILLTKVQLA